MRFRSVLLALCLAGASIALSAACAGDAPASTPSTDPSLDGKWEYAGYQASGTSLTVLVRHLGPGRVNATLDTTLEPSDSDLASGAGLSRFRFDSLSPGRHKLNIADGAITHARSVWLPPAALADLAPQEQRPLKPGEGFRIAAADVGVVFTGVLGDSRCPVDVQCIQAGDTTLSVTAYPKDAPAIEIVVVVPNGRPGGEVILSKYLIAAKSVTPEARSGQQPDFSAYQAEFSYAVGG